MWKVGDYVAADYGEEPEDERYAGGWFYGRIEAIKEEPWQMRVLFATEDQPPENCWLRPPAKGFGKWKDFSYQTPINEFRKANSTEVSYFLKCLEHWSKQSLRRS